MRGEGKFYKSWVEDTVFKQWKVEVAGVKFKFWNFGSQKEDDEIEHLLMDVKGIRRGYFSYVVEHNIPQSYDAFGNFERFRNEAHEDRRVLFYIGPDKLKPLVTEKQFIKEFLESMLDSIRDSISLNISYRDERQWDFADAVMMIEKLRQNYGDSSLKDLPRLMYSHKASCRFWKKIAHKKDELIKELGINPEEYDYEHERD